jgi:hypothetical protein
MTATAETITKFRARAEAARHQAATLPVWGLHPEAQAYWEDEGAVYRVKDMVSDWDYASRYERAADWLESRAGADTLAALYPSISIR